MPPSIYIIGLEVSKMQEDTPEIIKPTYNPTSLISNRSCLSMSHFDNLIRHPSLTYRSPADVETPKAQQKIYKGRL